MHALAQATGHAYPAAADLVLQEVNRVLGEPGCQVLIVGLPREGVVWWEQPKVIAAYVSLSDAHSQAVLYDVAEDEFLITTMAAWHEAYKRRAAAN